VTYSKPQSSVPAGAAASARKHFRARRSAGAAHLESAGPLAEVKAAPIREARRSIIRISSRLRTSASSTSAPRPSTPTSRSPRLPAAGKHVLLEKRSHGAVRGGRLIATPSTRQVHIGYSQRFTRKSYAKKKIADGTLARPCPSW